MKNNEEMENGVGRSDFGWGWNRVYVFKKEGETGMRTWRVGTFSMGASLLFLGLFLFLSRFLGYELVNVMTVWWPILLLVLGAEILLYLVLSRKESPVLKYDFLSIMFVGMIGTAGILLSVLSSMGLVGKVEEVMTREQRTFDLPHFSYNVDNHVKRVVVNTDGYEVTIEASPSREVSLFGTYQMETASKAKVVKAASEYVTVNQQGDTLYVTVKPLPNGIGPFRSYWQGEATILIPNDVKLETGGSDHPLTLKPRGLANNWSVSGVSTVAVVPETASDLKVSAIGVENVHGKEGQWKVTEDDRSAQKSAVYQSGQGKYQITITNA